MAAKIQRPSNFPRGSNAAEPPRVSSEVNSEIQQAFSAFDPSSTGVISQRAVKLALRALGHSVKKQEVLQLISKHNRGDTKSVALSAFQALCAEKFHSQSWQERARQAFQLLDLDGSGNLSLANVRVTASELCLNLSEEELSRMISEFDRDGDFCISEQEFLSIAELAEGW